MIGSYSMSTIRNRNPNLKRHIEKQSSNLFHIKPHYDSRITICSPYVYYVITVSSLDQKPVSSLLSDSE